MMTNVFDDEGNVIAVVKYTQNLDVWDGRNFQNGGTGYHLGITKLENGDYVLIRGSDWQGDTDSAEIISKKAAFNYIMKYCPDLLDEEKFAELNEFKNDLIKEV